MKTLILLSLFFSLPAWSEEGERLCRQVERVNDIEQRVLAEEFEAIADKAAVWAFTSPVPGPCKKAMAKPELLYGAARYHEVEFVKESLPLCNSKTGVHTRDVDAVNEPAARRIRIWSRAWVPAVQYERELFATHELAGVAGRINEPSTTSICWMLIPTLRFGVTIPTAEQADRLADGMTLVAEGGGGSTGGHGGGYIKVAAFKFRAIKTMLDNDGAFKSCAGFKDENAEQAFAGWLSESNLPLDVPKWSDAQILVKSAELGLGYPINEAERACLEIAAKK